VIEWTVDRLRRARRVGSIVVVCWDDQSPALSNLPDAIVRPVGARRAIASMDAVTVAQKWADGWRGGLMQSCSFDRGFHGATVERLCEEFDWPAVLLIDPAAGLVDPALVDALLDHAAAQPSHDLVFSPAAPGLCGVFLRRSLVSSLASGNMHPGRALHYVPTHPILDPLGRDASAPTPPRLARTSQSFLLDTARRVDHVTDACSGINAELLEADALSILDRLDAHEACARLPREVVLELTTRRATKPIYSPHAHLTLDRPDLTRDKARVLFTELAGGSDTRLILAGVGDPLLHENLFAILDVATECGLRTIAIETDLMGVSADVIDRLASAAVDVVTVHIPALTPATYTRVMGADALPSVIENVRRLLGARQTAGRVAPLLVPTFTKLRQNLPEMEAWYDQWLNALGHAVIVGPSEFAGQIPSVAVSDVSPPLRRACVRLRSRLTVLCDGSVVSCEQDVLGTNTLGRIGRNSIGDIWTGPLNTLRAAHACGQWSANPLCGNCHEWHRP